MQLTTFLSAVLPEDCYYFVATPSPTGHGFSHTACATLNELAARIQYLERETAVNVYYATAGYREEFIDVPEPQADGSTKVKRRYRTKANVKLVKAFWLDLDVGEQEPGKAAKYPDQRAALIALNDFLIKSKLPRPMVVSSGYGIHVYWPLVHSMLPAQWRATALQLKELTVGLGLLTDTTRTADEASVLRPIGTSNRKIKNGVPAAVPVRTLLPLEGQPVPVSDNAVFHDAVLAAMKEHNIEAIKTDTSGSLKVNPTGLIVPVGGFQKVSALKLIERCNQMKLFRETGGVSEPHWYRALQIMHHTTEGVALAHEWSRVHPEYTPAQTDAKLRQVEAMGPTLCATFNTANPEGCKDCPYAGKITTPVQLGARVEDAPAPVIKQVIDGEETTVELPKPPAPFKRGDSDQPGLYIEIEPGVPVRFYPYDLYPFEIVNDSGKLEGSVGVRHWLPQEGWKDFGVKLQHLEAPREFLGALRNNFVNPENGKWMMAYMDAYLRELQDKTRIKQLHTKLGWLPDGSFLLGNRLFTRKGTYPAGVSAIVSTKLVNSYHTKGSQEEWQKVVDRLDRPGLEGHLFSLLIGFGAPLFKLTGHGGVVASMWGATNAGKTFAACAMTSIYGSFDPFKAGKNDTFNARIERMGQLSNLPAYIDETTNIKSEDVSELMYQVSQGVGRTRLRSDSTVREPAEWSTIVLLSGNSSIVGKLMEAKANPEAELVRLFEFLVHKYPEFEAEMPKLYRILEDNYGWAGEKYIAHLVRLDYDDLRTQIRALSEMFAKAVGFEGKERFWMALVGCVLYGMWLAARAGAIKFADINATYQRMWKWCIDQIIIQRGTVVSNKITAVEALSMYLNAHLADRLVVSEQKVGSTDLVVVVKPPAAHGKLLIEYNQTKGTLFIDQSNLRNWFNKLQLDPQQIKQDLLADRIMVPHEGDFKVTMGRGTQYKSGQTRVWHIDAKHRALDVDAILEKDAGEVPQ